MDFKNLIKTAGIFSLSAFLLAVLFGIIGSVSVGYIILRAIIFALVFAGLGAAVYIIYDRFLQVEGGISQPRDENDAAAGSRIGGNLDITSDAEGIGETASTRSDEGAEGELVEVGGSDIDLESVGAYNESMTDLDDLAENFAAMSNGEDLGEISGDFNVSGSELGERTPPAGGAGGGSAAFASDVTLEDIGGPDSTPQDYAKVVRTMLKKDE